MNCRREAVEKVVPRAGQSRETAGLDPRRT